MTRGEAGSLSATLPFVPSNPFRGDPADAYSGPEIPLPIAEGLDTPKPPIVLAFDRGPSGYPCIDDKRQYTAGLCAGCGVARCWTGVPLNHVAIPPRMTFAELPRRSDLSAECRRCANVADVSPPGEGDKSPTVWCERWHWQAPITEYELAEGMVPAKAGCCSPCPDFAPLIQLRPFVATSMEADRVRARRNRQKRKGIAA